MWWWLDRFVGTGLDLSAAQKKVKAMLAKRQTTQLFYPNAGCVFKNVSARGGSASGGKDSKFENFLKNNPGLKLPKEFLKNKSIPAAWLIETAKLKGKKIGQAQIAKKHANFIINLGDAKAKEVIKLIALVKKNLKNKFKLEPEEEIQRLGF